MRRAHRQTPGRKRARFGRARRRPRPEGALRGAFGERKPRPGGGSPRALRPLDHARLLPKRFDTHFFLALAPPGQALAHDGREAVDSVWISPREALAEHGKRFKLLFPTERNLWKLAAHADAASALAAARASPVVTVLPEPVEVDGGPGLRIPAEAGYGGEVFSVRGLL